MEDAWLTRAKRLQAIASSGQHFGESDFDRERFDEIFSIASQMLADLGNVPVQTIIDLNPDAGDGYATPKVDVRGAVFFEGRILLVREKLDGLWTLPGGYADVGLSPTENIEKEVFEEANLTVKVRKLFALVHKARHEYDADTRDFYKLFFLCNIVGNPTPSPGAETQEARYFELDNLPPLSAGRVIQKHILLARTHFVNPSLPTDFD